MLPVKFPLCQKDCNNELDPTQVHDIWVNADLILDWITYNENEDITIITTMCIDSSGDRVDSETLFVVLLLEEVTTRIQEAVYNQMMSKAEAEADAMKRFVR